jgi:lysophospholipase L1-like esterase
MINKLPPGGKLLFIGDSITDAGRDAQSEITPWNVSTSLGIGYVSMVQALLDVADPFSRIRVVNKGISGHTIRDLKSRWQADVIDQNPDCLVVFIGINDVWRQFDCPLRKDMHVPKADYAAIYRELLSKTRPQLKSLLLVGPYVVESDRASAFRQMMESYAEIVRQLAVEFDAVYVDTQSAFDRLMVNLWPTEIAWDRIHPSRTGHMAIAREVLAGLGVPLFPAAQC